jgi:N-acetyltransferase 10
LVVIDEAAAIPLPLVKKLLGPYLVFMASTINGYEGTGRSLSLKLIQQLREQSRGFVGKAEGPLKDASGEDIVVGRDLKSKKDSATSDINGTAVGGRSLREIKLEEPIRYGTSDPIEKWLNKLLCLDATIVSKNIQGCPHPSECELFYVNRDTLFSYHPVSETFLQRMMALYVASHYKNSPNDLQLMSDAPAHHLFVLLPPVRDGDTGLPDPLVVIQVALEGEISKQSVMNSLSRGQRAGGDLIPWLVSQQFQDDDFATLSGARVVRIATHPDYAKMGYGHRALEQLKSFYQGEITSLDENAMEEDNEEVHRVDDDELEEADLLTDDVRIRDPRKMPPLLMRLSEKKPTRLHYLGVSYGLTQQLHRFWKKSGFVPLYLRQTPNELTGEHTCVMLNTLNSSDLINQTSEDWLDAFARDFKKRFINLLSYQFRNFQSITALSILEAASAGTNRSNNNTEGLNKELLKLYFNAYDLKRLESYSNNMLDYHVIMDMLPTISELLFKDQMAGHVKLSGVQNSILLALGLQRKSVDDLETELSLPSSQILALFIKAIRKISAYFKEVQSKAIEAETGLPVKRPRVEDEEEDELDGRRDIQDVDSWQAVKEDLDEDLEEAGQQAIAGLKEKQRDLINSLDLKKYAIGGADEDWEAAEDQIKASQADSKVRSVVSVKNDNSSKKNPRRKTETAAEIAAKEANRKVGKNKMSKKTRRG